MSRLTLHHEDTHYVVDDSLLWVSGPYRMYAGMEMQANGFKVMEPFHAGNLNSLRTTLPFVVWNHLSNVIGAARRAVEPRHHSDEETPCWGCGQPWGLGEDLAWSLVHDEDCAYLRFGQWSDVTA